MIPAEFPGLAGLALRTGHEPASVEPLPGDVGRRRYLRFLLKGDRTVLGVAYPPEELESCRRWNAARAVLQGSLRVPFLLADDGSGNQIVEDFGRQDLSDRLLGNPEERALWLGRCARAASALARLPDPGINPPFDAAFFRRELDLAREAVFDLWLGQPLSETERETHDAWAEGLAQEVSAHPRALCHRDFHGNNLFAAGDEVAAIDFQDLREGPDAYDLASLLWERTTLEWMTPGLADSIIEDFAAIRRLQAEDFRRRFDRVLLQRAWKVCGTFARALAQRRAERYRRYLPRQIALVGRLLVGTGSVQTAFRRLYETRLAPLC